MSAPSVPEGASVVVHHLRQFASLDHVATRGGAAKLGITEPPLSKGGVTLVQIEFEDGRTVRGAARCNPLDNYSKARGRMIATGRALKALETA